MGYFEYNGPYSDTDARWSDALKKKYNICDSGLFHMDPDDFVQHFKCAVAVKVPAMKRQQMKQSVSQPVQNKGNESKDDLSKQEQERKVNQAQEDQRSKQAEDKKAKQVQEDKKAKVKKNIPEPQEEEEEEESDEEDDEEEEEEEEEPAPKKKSKAKKAGKKNKKHQEARLWQSQIETDVVSKGENEL
jgi:RNA recognition motif-containing protein